MHLDVCLYIQDWILAVDSDSGKWFRNDFQDDFWQIINGKDSGDLHEF